MICYLTNNGWNLLLYALQWYHISFQMKEDIQESGWILGGKRIEEGQMKGNLDKNYRRH